VPNTAWPVAVQHGASTLPNEAFDRFPATTSTAEIHLATDSRIIVYDSPNFPPDLHERIYDYPEPGGGFERKEGIRKSSSSTKPGRRGSGPSNGRCGDLPQGGPCGPGRLSWRRSSPSLFRKLNVGNTLEVVNRFVTPVDVPLKPPDGLG